MPASCSFHCSSTKSSTYQRGYGVPKAGSLTEARGRKAQQHIAEELVQLCMMIEEVAAAKAKVTKRNVKTVAGKGLNVARTSASSKMEQKKGSPTSSKCVSVAFSESDVDFSGPDGAPLGVPSSDEGSSSDGV